MMTLKTGSRKNTTVLINHKSTNTILNFQISKSPFSASDKKDKDSHRIPCTKDVSLWALSINEMTLIIAGVKGVSLPVTGLQG